MPNRDKRAYKALRAEDEKLILALMLAIIVVAFSPILIPLVQLVGKLRDRSSTTLVV